MANFANGYTLTTAGAALMADVEVGKTTLKLTRVQLGSGTVNSTSDYDNRTALVTPQNSMTITDLTTEDVDTVRTCKITVSLTSDKVETGYNATEIGIFANDSTGTEILYGVCYDANAGYIPSKSDGNNTTITFVLRIATTTEATIELVLPKTAQELVALVQEKAGNAIDSATAAAKSASEASDSAAKAALSTTAAAGYSDSAKASASTAAASQTAAKASETAAAESASSAVSTEETVAAMYMAMLFDIVGPPPSEMDHARFIVGAGPAAMASS